MLVLSLIQQSQASSAVLYLRNVLHRLCKSFPAKVRIPAGSLNISVSKQFLNFVQSSTSVHEVRSKAMPQIVNPKLWHACPNTRTVPTVKETDKGLASLWVCKNSSPIPMAWLNVAAMLPGKTLNVGLAIWWLAGMSKTAAFKITGKAL